jgi:hypothetical protein
VRGAASSAMGSLMNSMSSITKAQNSAHAGFKN